MRAELPQVVQQPGLRALQGSTYRQPVPATLTTRRRASGLFRKLDAVAGAHGPIVTGTPVRPAIVTLRHLPRPRVFSKLDGLTRFLAPSLTAPQLPKRRAGHARSGTPHSCPPAPVHPVLVVRTGGFLPFFVDARPRDLGHMRREPIADWLQSGPRPSAASARLTSARLNGSGFSGSSSDQYSIGESRLYATQTG